MCPEVWRLALSEASLVLHDCARRWHADDAANDNDKELAHVLRELADGLHHFASAPEAQWQGLRAVLMRHP